MWGWGVFFLLGMLVVQLPVEAGERFARGNTQFVSSERVSLDSITVFPDKVIIDTPNIRYARVASNSMAPAFTDKSKVFELPPSSPEDIQIGDVISFREGDMVIMHRVIEIADGQYRTKGDANKEADKSLVSFDQIEGVVVGSFR